MTLVPGESARELIKASKTIARFPRVRKVVFPPFVLLIASAKAQAFQPMCVLYTGLHRRDKSLLPGAGLRRR